MSQKIVAVVGISGVGKTTFLSRVAAKCEFQHLSAGTLIAQGRSLASTARDSLRSSNLDENQSLLVEGFKDASDPDAKIIILDGHVVMLSPVGLAPIDSRVFASLGIDIIAHLEADPPQILSNRLKDTGRERPSLSIEELGAHQIRSLAEARRVADDLGIELKRLTHDDDDVFGRFLCDQS